MCGSLIHLFSGSANVRIPCLEQITPHSLLGMKCNKTLFTSKWSKSLAGHTLSHPCLTFCGLQWSSQVVRLYLQKDSQIFYPLRHMFNQLSKRCYLGPVLQIPVPLLTHPTLFHLAPLEPRRLTLGTRGRGSFLCLAPGKPLQVQMDLQSGCSHSSRFLPVRLS